MAVAAIGPLTAVLESTATALAAGAVVGSSAVGVVGLVAGWPAGVLERRALSDGYIGAAIGVLVVLFDVVLRYVI